MCENWDFACEKASGEFIIIIGDDDGVMPGSIDYLENFIKENPSDIYYWDNHIYTWPKQGKQAEINYIAVRENPSPMNVQKMVRETITWGTNKIARLPMVYHSAVSQKVLNKIKEKTGKIFHSVNPDIFSAYALPVFTNRAINLGRVITVSGRSPKANSSGDDAIVERFLKEFGDYQWHPNLNTKWPRYVYFLLDTILVAMELFPEFYGDIKFNYSAMWAVCRKKVGKNVLEIIRSRKEIRKYHSFDVAIFLSYLAGHYLSGPWERLSGRKARIARRTINRGNPPNNILEFVNLVAEV